MTNQENVVSRRGVKEVIPILPHPSAVASKPKGETPAEAQKDSVMSFRDFVRNFTGCGTSSERPMIGNHPHDSTTWQRPASLLTVREAIELLRSECSAMGFHYAPPDTAIWGMTDPTDSNYRRCLTLVNTPEGSLFERSSVIALAHEEAARRVTLPPPEVRHPDAPVATNVSPRDLAGELRKTPRPRDLQTELRQKFADDYLLLR